MAIIPDGMQFIGISPDIVLQEKKSAQVNGKSEPYRMTDIIETVSAEILTGADWGDIEGTLSEQTDLQSALDAKQDDLVSGTNIKTVNGSTILGSGNLQITTTDQWGDITGTLSNQTDLQNALNDKQDTLVSGTNIKTINGESLLGSTDIETASVNTTSTFLPINTSGSFTDSPFYTLPPPVNFVGFGGIGTKSVMYGEAPIGGVPNYNDFGLEIKSFSTDTMSSSVSLGDYDSDMGSQGEAYWYTGSPLTFDSSGNPPFTLAMNTSGFNFSTSGYNLFESALSYFKLDAKTGNPSRVDGLLFNTNAGGFGYGRGLENGIGSYEESIYWNLITGDFNIKGIYGSNVLFSNPALAQTYIMDGPSKLGIEMSAMYISDDLAVTTAVSGTYTKVLNVRDESGNSYAIKLHSY